MLTNPQDPSQPTRANYNATTLSQNVAAGGLMIRGLMNTIGSSQGAYETIGFP